MQHKSFKIWKSFYDFGLRKRGCNSKDNLKGGQKNEFEVLCERAREVKRRRNAWKGARVRIRGRIVEVIVRSVRARRIGGSKREEEIRRYSMALRFTSIELVYCYTRATSLPAFTLSRNARDHRDERGVILPPLNVK